MTKSTTRTAQLGGAKERTSINLTADEWRDLECFSGEEGIKWVEWAARAVAAAPHLKKVAAIRKALQEARSAARLDPFEPTEEAFGHEYVRQARFFDDSDLDLVKSQIREVWAVDCGGYVVRFGFNTLNPGNDPILLIESRMKDGVNMTFAASNEADE